MIDPVVDAVMRPLRHSRYQVLRWMLRHALFSCFTSSWAVIASQDRPEIFCWVEVRAVLWPRSPPETGKVLPAPILRLPDCVGRFSVLHADDLAGVGYQRTLKNPAALLIACRHSLARICAVVPSHH